MLPYTRMSPSVSHNKQRMVAKNAGGHDVRNRDGFLWKRLADSALRAADLSGEENVVLGQDDAAVVAVVGDERRCWTALLLLGAD